MDIASQTLIKIVPLIFYKIFIRYLSVVNLQPRYLIQSTYLNTLVKVSAAMAKINTMPLSWRLLFCKNHLMNWIKGLRNFRRKIS